MLELSWAVILAEAGTGKTHELRETAQRLRREGNAAFFCRIEDLADRTLEHAFIEGDPEEFDRWLESDQPAWFFLDSVDEARLANPRSFERALRDLARRLGPAVGRAGIFITARVSDWRAEADLSLIKEVLPPATPFAKAKAQQMGSREPDRDEPARLDSEGTDASDVQVVQLAPLTVDQMRRFAAAQKVDHVAAFMEAIERSDTAIFAERPQDLLELIAYWNERGAIGSHAEMIALNIEKKLLESNPDRDEVRPLAKEKAFEGAMLLASALTLTRKSSIILPDRPVDSDRVAQAINAGDVLPSWDGSAIQALLGRALFDEATYGRVRFHHRSVGEYLTAQWLRHLLESNKPRRAVEGLMFAARYGIDIVVPSMRPMAAWLALWDDRIRDRILRMAPEVLLEHGDPSRLPVDVRAQLLRRFASLNEGRSDTGASFDLASVRRLADPQLAATVLDLLDRHRANEDIRQLLLRTIWQGKMSECAEAAISFALDTSMDSYTRICGIHAVAAADTNDERRRLAQAILADIGDWGNRALGEAVAALYPDTLTLQELLAIGEAAEPPPRYSVHSLDEALERIVTLDSSLQNEILLEGFVRLLEREPHINPRHCQVSKRYAWLLGPAAKLAERAIVSAGAGAVEFGDATLRAIKLEAQGQHYRDGHGRRDHRLRELIGSLPALRHALFWREVQQQRVELTAKGERLTEWWQTDVRLMFWDQFSIDDFDSFLHDVHHRQATDDRLVALTAAFTLWRRAGRARSGRERMWQAVRSEPKLEARLHALFIGGLAPLKSDATAGGCAISNIGRQRDVNGKSGRDVNGWLAFKTTSSVSATSTRPQRPHASAPCTIWQNVF